MNRTDFKEVCFFACVTERERESDRVHDLSE